MQDWLTIPTTESLTWIRFSWCQYCGAIEEDFVTNERLLERRRLLEPKALQQARESTVTDQLVGKELARLSPDNKIEVIKMVRERTGIGLREAYDLVTKYLEEMKK